MRRHLVAAVALGVTVIAVPALAHAAYPGKNGKLAIEGDTRAGIWTVKSNGSDLTRVSGKQGLPFAPSWSPNGRWIAFTQSGGLWKMHADGSHKEKLAKGVSSDIDTNVSWSPDGRRLAFSKNDDLWTVHANGKKSKRITNTAKRESSPSWSPKGDRIAFGFLDTSVGGVRELRLINPNGANETSIPNTINGTNPDWSPNGKRLAYSALGTGIRIIKPDGTGQKTFAKNGKNFVVDPAWSPDGRQIAYAHNVSLSRTQIVRKRVSGGKEHIVVKSKHWFNPSWQPVM